MEMGSEFIQAVPWVYLSHLHSGLGKQVRWVAAQCLRAEGFRDLGPAKADKGHPQEDPLKSILISRIAYMG